MELNEIFCEKGTKKDLIFSKGFIIKWLSVIIGNVGGNSIAYVTKKTVLSL